MKAVVIGAGRIGCGFAGQVLHAAGFQVVFVARNPALVAHLNRLGRYHVRLVQGQDVHEVVVTGIRAISKAHAGDVAAEIARADLLVTAVGADHLAQVAPLIASGLRQRSAPLNSLAFENLADAGPRLRGLVADHLPGRFPLEKHGFSGVLVSRAVTRRLGDPAGDAPLVFIGDPPATFVVDGPALRPPLPAVQGMVVAEDYAAQIQRKLYIFSAGHATAAYLGYLKGYHYIHTAIRDPEIRAAVLAAMAEGQRGLARRYGPTIAGTESDLLDIIARFENAALNDPVVRVGRDPRRKLSPEDRLVGAARLAASAGIRPEKLALAVAAALCYSHPADPSAIALQREIRTDGLGPILRRVSGLDPARGLGRFIADLWDSLAAGWQNGNLLLSLENKLWAWHA